MVEAQTKQNKRSGVLICGAYGQGNAGDEAVLRAIVGQMRAIDPNMPITVMTRTPEKTAADHGVHTLHSFDMIGFIRAASSAELFLNGGGSLIQDVTSRRSLWYYLFTLRTARALGCKVIMYGCGIGPVNHSGDRKMTRRILNKTVDIITLREDASLAELHALGVEAPEIVLSADPALTLEPAAAGEVDAEFLRRGMDPKGKYICFALRDWDGFEEKTVCFRQAAEYAYEKYALTPLFVSINHVSDGEASARATSDIGCPYHIIDDTMPSDLTIGVLSRMAAVVSMRLHGLIFSAGHGIPLIAVSYDPKVTAFMGYIGQNLCVELHQLTADRLCGMIDEAVAEAVDKQYLAAQVERLRAIEERNSESVRRLLGRQEGNR